MPRPGRIDRLFARFVRSGDARALGRVFDATAPELLKIAAYLSGDRQQAEDLVQSTFLVAIERRGDFDTSCPVMPWLCGIVANLARAERRRAARQTGAAAPGAVLDPAAEAEMAEFREAFARARDALPEPYRPVLELHLEHGLSACEIARVLERPAGTVRAQITRGLERLRRRLPRGFVAGALVAATTPAALQAMRTTILSQARIAAGAPALAVSTAAPWTATLIGGAIMTKKLIAIGVIASLLALGVWFAAGAPSDLGNDPPLAPDHAALTASGSDADVDDQASGAERRAAEPEAAGSTAAEGHGRVAVTAHWKGTGAPAARQAVEVVCGGRLPELEPRRALTDDEGRCVIEGVPAGSVSVFASTGDRAAVSVEECQTTAVALELGSWGKVRGIVVDAHGRPAPGAGVWVPSEVRYRPLGRGAGPGHGQFGSITLCTDAGGRFETRLDRRQCVAAFKVGHGPSATIYPCSGKAPAGGIDVVLRLAAEGSALALEVRDASGAPVAGAQVMAGPEVPHFVDDMTKATTPALRASTDENGRAELGPLPSGSLPLQARAPGFAPWRGKHELPPGGRARLRIRLEAAATVHGIALDSDGAPVAGALVWHGPPRQAELVAVHDRRGRAIRALRPAPGNPRAQRVEEGDRTLPDQDDGRRG